MAMVTVVDPLAGMSAPVLSVNEISTLSAVVIGA